MRMWWDDEFLQIIIIVVVVVVVIVVVIISIKSYQNATYTQINNSLYTTYVS